MDKATRNAIERATQQARRLLDDDFSSQLEGAFDVQRSGVIAPKGGAHLLARQHFHRDKIIAAIEHKRAAGTTAVDAVTDYVRDAAFTALNRFVALKMLEARELVQECITKGEQSAGYKEFCGMAPGVALLPDATGYRLYVESLFDEFSTEIKVLFDRRDAASVLWPKRQTFDALLSILNASDLSGVWGEDETIGWVYQFFNSGEERKIMRDESAAPRNSRELAVRNQFFTPRYVVQFLVDNTLGRIWLEMHGGQTRLTSLCGYLVRSAEEPAQARPKKDPRDLRILDPACGSGHFLLYSFDLLLAIYEEAWSADEPGPKSDATGVSLREDYPDLGDLLRQAPKLIVEHNLHGVDIDPRCAQIAALALWLRAQRAWKDIAIAASDRPRIQRTHIVVAESMPGIAALIDDFAGRLDPPLLRDLFKKMVGESRLAGELGVLLRGENGIAVELRRAREQFTTQRQTTGFLPGMEPAAKQGALNLSGIDDDRFFHEAETQILGALRAFGETTTGNSSVRRRLFAGDAAHGVALLDLVRTRFDVVLMNPPFGAGSLAAKKDFEKAYPQTKNDIYAAFVERGIELLLPHGMLGAITSRTGFFLKSYQKWREDILLKYAPPTVLADLGYGVLDGALVEVAAYCLRKGLGTNSTIFLRVLEELSDKDAALRIAIKGDERATGKQRFELDAKKFSAIPGSPFAYWVGDRVRNLFAKNRALQSDGQVAASGASSNDDIRFIRASWEVPTDNATIHPFAKGGRFSPFYDDVHLCIRWHNDGEEIKTYVIQNRESKGWSPHWKAELHNPHLYLRPGLTWPRRTKSELSFRVMPAGCIFGDKGPAVISDRDDEQQLFALLALGSSRSFRALVELQLAAADARRGGAARSYEVGVLQRTPIPRLSHQDQANLANLAHRAWSLKRNIDTCTENSHAFVLPAVLQVPGDTLAIRSTSWADHVRSVESEIESIQNEIDALCLDFYGIDEADRHAITHGFDTEYVGVANGESDGDSDLDAEAELDGDNNAGASSDAVTLAAELVSWAAGVSIGRFDARLATGTRPKPAEPKPFDPLPVCSSAMLAGIDGLPILSAPPGYPIDLPHNGILVDDRGHPLDLTAAMRIVFERTFKEHADAWWDDVGGSLDPKDHDLRTWITSGLFGHHLKYYSKSRRKAPILWQLAVPSGRYAVWLYAHRLTRDTLFQIQNDIVTPKLAHEERQLTNLIQSAGATPSANERKEIGEQEASVADLRSFLDEVKRVAPLWKPNLDDGVVLSMAPLWRLVPQHKAWQKELKSKWEELAVGDYDWAQVAMHLWPARVVSKCVTDRSLAIAHGLQAIFWLEGDDGKWKPRKNPTRSIDELVRERSSVAVEAALNALTEAPAPSGQKAKARRS